ncbi:MAG: hypothetical protein C5B59_17575 [Bacteroidetes bacterium]|nr:MAG: hypothetical protein C5B59_17575 [Bacteroidota bacterium]
MIKRILGNLYFLTFLNGFLLASLFYFKMEGNYEKELFSAIRSNIDREVNFDDTDDSIVVKVMHACHSLLITRAIVFSSQSLDGFKVDYLQPTSIDLMTARGACGSYAIVLARSLQDYKFPVRIAQMKVHGVYAAHNIVEAKTRNGWVVLDPLFNIYFLKPGDKGLADFEDVHNHWDFYKTQLPANYDMNFNYEGVRYSNWTKVPIIMPAAKKMLDMVLGKEKADRISVRTFFLRTYDVYFFLTFILFIPIFFFTLSRLIKTKVFPKPEIPMTITNIFKYSKAKIGHASLENDVNPTQRQSLS